MRNLFRSLVLVLFFINNFCQVHAQECPYQVLCLNAGGDDIVRVSYSNGTTMPDQVTFIYNGVTYADQTPVYESSSFQDFSLQFCFDPGGTGPVFLDIQLIINGVSCNYINGVLQGQGDGDGLVCPSGSGCANWEGFGFYLYYNDLSGQVFQPLTNGATFYFDNYPCLNGTYVPTLSVDVNGVIYAYFDQFTNVLPCDVQTPLHNFTVVLSNSPNEIVCVIENAALCETCEPNIPADDSCEEFLTDCGNGIIEYAQDYLDLDEDGCKPWGNSCSPHGIIKRTGKVGIGTSDIPTGYNLAVKGVDGKGIVTEQFMVCADAWCDYVFEEGYDLMPLGEVEKYIQANGHLHGFPSESNIIEDGGFDLGEIVFKQQEKIEEAFLHIIDIDKMLNNIDSLFYKK